MNEQTDTIKTFDDAKVELSNAVYEAARLLETLEYAGKIRGNGHHMRQEVARFAVDLLKERWVEDKP